MLFDDNQASGVEVEKDGQTFNIHAKKEVILSAGTIESPRLLMLSGIGPRQHLQQHKVFHDFPLCSLIITHDLFFCVQIPVKMNLPVGSNLQDHPMCVLEYSIEMPPSINVDKSLENKSSQDYAQFLFFSRGAMSIVHLHSSQYALNLV